MVCIAQDGKGQAVQLVPCGAHEMCPVGPADGSSDNYPWVVQQF